MHPIDQLDQIIPALIQIVDATTDDQLGAPTPCDQFRVVDVMDHMIGGGSVFAHLFRGETPPAEPPTFDPDVVPAPMFRSAMEGLLAAVKSDGAMARTLQTPLGEMDGETFARVVAFDGLVHAWDLAVSTGGTLAVSDATVAEVDGFARQAVRDELRGGEMFDWPTLAPEDASPIEALAAFSGRKVDATWRRASATV